MGGGNLRRGGRAGNADHMLVDDGGAVDQHDGIGVAAAGGMTTPAIAAFCDNSTFSALLWVALSVFARYESDTGGYRYEQRFEP